MNADAVVREYDRLASRYDRRWAWYIRATTEATAARIEVQAGEMLLDIGCGTGALLDLLRKREPALQLAGVDLSAEMLARARAKLPGAIRLEQGLAEQLPFGDGEFDVVVSISAFHYFREPAAALKEIRRVLRPSGKIVITDWCDDFLACRLCDRWLRWVDPAHARTYSGTECRKLLDEAGFASVQIERYKINWLWGVMTARAIRA